MRKKTTNAGDEIRRPAISLQDSPSIRSNSYSNPHFQVCDSPELTTSGAESGGTFEPELPAQTRRNRRATTQQAPSLTSPAVSPLAREPQSQLPPREVSSQSLCVGAGASSSCARLEPGHVKVARSNSQRQSVTQAQSPFLTPSSSHQNLHLHLNANVSSTQSDAVMSQSQSASPSGGSSRMSSRESLSSSGGGENPSQSQSHLSTYAGGGAGAGASGSVRIKEMGSPGSGPGSVHQQTHRAPAPLILCPEPSDETPPSSPPGDTKSHSHHHSKNHHNAPLPQQHSLERLKGRSSEHRTSDAGSVSSITSKDRACAKRHSCSSEDSAGADAQLLKVDQNGHLTGGRHPKLNSRSASIRLEHEWRGANCEEAAARRREETRRGSLAQDHKVQWHLRSPAHL